MLRPTVQNCKVASADTLSSKDDHSTGIDTMAVCSVLQLSTLWLKNSVRQLVKVDPKIDTGVRNKTESRQNK